MKSAAAIRRCPGTALGARIGETSTESGRDPEARDTDMVPPELSPWPRAALAAPVIRFSSTLVSSCLRVASLPPRTTRPSLLARIARAAPLTITGAPLGSQSTTAVGSRSRTSRAAFRSTSSIASWRRI